MAQQARQEHWLDKYATGYATWRSDGDSFKRPLGLVETSFDTDGNYYGGRADMTATFTLAINHNLSKDELRRRIAVAWTCLRLQHVLLMSRTEDDVSTGKRRFVVDVPKNPADATKRVEEGIVWLEDLYDGIDEKELHHHALNVGRIVEPTSCMSKLHILPLQRQPDGTFHLRLLIVIGHQISDGLSAYNWFSHFIKLLNTPLTDLSAFIAKDISPDSISSRLPSAQEDLYPPITGNIARQRWFWALIRVLRHVNKTLPPTFTNPLRRAQRLEKAIVLPPKYNKIFNYSPKTLPPNSSGHIAASLSHAASTRLISLCRSANVSIGAGCFALAGLSMMELHESLSTSTSSDTSRPAFAASFPLNPRGFFANPPPAESCMLAFSEGIVMPFLSSDLPIEGRFRLVAKHANRELRVYQKRLKGKETGLGGGVLDKHSPGRLLATGYLAQIERVEAKLPLELRNKSIENAQGELKPSVGAYGATCGVSSVGSVAAFFRKGTHDLHDMNGKDLVADFRELKMGVRARENEFLVGSSTNAEGIVGFGVSYDLNAISQEAAETWAKKISGLLEKGDGAKL